MIPQHLAGEYADRLAERDRAQQEIAWATGALQVVPDRVRIRLSKPKLLGAADVASLKVLAPLPAALVAVAPYVGDEQVRAQVARLEELLGVSLVGAGGGTSDLPAAKPHGNRV
jgi:hypothetical protein